MSRRPDIDDLITLKIDNVSHRTVIDDLDILFGKFGKIGDIHIPKDGRTGDNKGFAFVRFVHKEDAEDAMDDINGRKFDGRELRIQFAKNRKTEWKDFNNRSDRRSRSRSGRRRSRSRSPRGSSSRKRRSRSRRRSRDSKSSSRLRSRSKSRNRSKSRRGSKSKSKARHQSKSRSHSKDRA